MIDISKAELGKKYRFYNVEGTDVMDEMATVVELPRDNKYGYLVLELDKLKVRMYIYEWNAKMIYEV